MLAIVILTVLVNSQETSSETIISFIQLQSTSSLSFLVPSGLIPVNALSMASMETIPNPPLVVTTTQPMIMIVPTTVQIINTETLTTVLSNTLTKIVSTTATSISISIRETTLMPTIRKPIIHSYNNAAGSFNLHHLIFLLSGMIVIMFL